MKKFIKISVWTLGILALTVTLLVYSMADKIEAGILKELNKTLAVEGSYKKAHVVFWKTFPYMSVELNQLVIKESTPITQEPLLTANKLYLQFNLIQALRGQFELSRLRGETMTLYMAYQNKQNNFELFKEDTAQKSADDFEIKLKSIAFTDLHFRYADWDDQDFLDLQFESLETEGKLDNKSVFFSVEAKAQSKNITLDQDEWAVNKALQINTKLHYDIEKELLQIEQGSLAVSTTRLNLNGSIALGQQDSINLKLETSGSEIQVLSGLMPEAFAKPLKTYKSTGAFSADIHIYGKMKNEFSPNIDANVKIIDGQITPPGSGAVVEQLNINMRYTDLHNQKPIIHVPNISFSIDKQSIQANLEIHNPESPFIKGAVKGTLNLASLSSFLPENIPAMGGQIVCGFKVEGLVAKMGTEYFTDRGLDGFIEFKNVHGSLAGSHPSEPYIFEHCNGKWEMQGNRIFSPKFQGKINSHNFELSVGIENLLPYWFKNQKISVIGNIGLQSFEWKDPIGVDPKEAISSDPTDLFELFPANMELDLDLKLGTLQYNQALWKDLSARVFVNHNRIDLRNLKIGLAGGQLNGAVFATPRNNNQVYVNLQCEAQNIQVEQLFDDFNNWGQEELTSKNLSGKLSFKTHCVMLIDRNGTINKEHIYAFSEVQIKEGALKNYEAMRALSDYAEVKELEHIRFSSLENSFEVRDGQVNFPFMHIGSNVLNLSIKGKHHFDNYMDYTFKIKLSDALAAKYKIRSKKSTEDFEDLGNKGVALYINMTGYADDLKFKLQKVGGRPVIIPEKVAEEAKQARKEFKEVLGREFSEEKRIKEKERQAEEEQIEWDEW